MRRISKREIGLPKVTIQKLLSIVAESKEIISLGAGEPDFSTPKPILDYSKKIISKSTHYSPTLGRMDLRKAIVNKLRKENKIDCDENNILVTVGSQEAIFSTLLSTIDPYDEVMIGNPGYMDYLPAIQLVNGKTIFFRLDAENNFEVVPDRIKKVVNKKKSKVLIINTPSNPTGNVISRKILENIADIAVENDLYVISDEAYEKIIYDKKHVSIGSLNGMKDYVITLQTFSKSHAMCGFRVGYACGPKELIQAMSKVSHYLIISPPNISQMLALKALSIKSKYINEMVEEYRKRRDYIIKELNIIGLKTNKPDGTFYAFSNIKNYSKDSLKFCNDLLNKYKVAAVPGVEFGKYGEGYVRFSYATKMPLIKAGLERLDKFLKLHF